MPSVRTDLRAAVKYGLETITAVNGYNNTIRRVYDPPVPFDTMREYPSINIIWGRERRLTDAEFGLGNNPKLTLRLDVQFDCVLHSVNNMQLDQDEILWDIQKYFGENYYVPKESGGYGAFNCIYSESTPFGIDSNKPNCGINIVMELYYTQRLKDPTKKT